MTIPMLDLKRQIAPIRKEIDEAIKKVIDSAHFVFGPEIKDFEADVRVYTSSRFAVGVSNGTDAIKLALLGLGIKEGDAVICPSFTYYATAGAVAAIGAKPVFADIDPLTYTITADSIEEALKKHKRLKVKAVIPVHLYGQCADMSLILKLARRYKLKVIEDTAQAFGAEYKGRKAGTLGDCGTVSFFPGKNLGAFGDAGMILTNHEPVAKRLCVLRNQGNEQKYYHTVLGHNHRLDTLQAAVLKVRLKYLDQWNKQRQLHAAYYNGRFAKLNMLTPYVPLYTTHTYHQYVLRLRTRSDKLIAYLHEKGIDARVFYPVPLHLQKCFKYLGYKAGDFPEAEKASKQIVAIPVFPDLTPAELEYIASTIEGYFA